MWGWRIFARLTRSEKGLPADRKVCPPLPTAASLVVLHLPCGFPQRWSVPRPSSLPTLGGPPSHHTRPPQQACPKVAHGPSSQHIKGAAPSRRALDAFCPAPLCARLPQRMRIRSRRALASTSSPSSRFNSRGGVVSMPLRTHSNSVIFVVVASAD